MLVARRLAFTVVVLAVGVVCGAPRPTLAADATV